MSAASIWSVSLPTLPSSVGVNKVKASKVEGSRVRSSKGIGTFEIFLDFSQRIPSNPVEIF
jgi:hypothetical protein